MGKRGPKPKDKPVAVPIKGIPAPPEWLDGVARQHWRKIARLLNEAGIGSALDADALAFYVTHWSRWRKAEKELARPELEGGGEIVKAPNLYLQPNPWLVIAQASLKEMKSYLAELGLSPKARSKLIMAEREEVDAKWKEFEESPTSASGPSGSSTT